MLSGVRESELVQNFQIATAWILLSWRGRIAQPFAQGYASLGQERPLRGRTLATTLRIAEAASHPTLIRRAVIQAGDPVRHQRYS